MTPLAQLLDRIGWSVPHLAGRLGVPHQTVYRWHAGRNSRGNPCEAPGEVTAWLTRIAAEIESIEPPTRGDAWR